MARPNLPPQPNPQNSVEEPITSQGGGLLANADFSPVFTELRRYGYTAFEDPRFKPAAAMMFPAAGADAFVRDRYRNIERDEHGRPIERKLSEDFQNMFRNPYKTDRTGTFAINPRQNIKVDAKGKSNEYTKRTAEWLFDDRIQGVARSIGNLALNGAKFLVGQRPKPHHSHYTSSTGIGRYGAKLRLADLPANYDAHPDLFRADNLKQLSDRIDNAIVQERLRLGRPLTATEARNIRGDKVSDYVDLDKDPFYPNTPALQEMVSVQERIERRSREDTKAAQARETARQAMQQRAEAAEKLQEDANNASVRTAELAEDEVVNAAQRHQELIDELHGNHNELLNFLEDEILTKLADIKDAVKDIPDLKTSFDTFVQDWQAEKRDAAADRSQRVQADARMLNRLDLINDGLRNARREASDHATAQATVATEQADAMRAQADAMHRQADATEAQADSLRDLRDIAEELMNRPAAEATTPASATAGETSRPGTPSAPGDVIDIDPEDVVELRPEDDLTKQPDTLRNVMLWTTKENDPTLSRGEVEEALRNSGVDPNRVPGMTGSLLATLAARGLAVPTENEGTYRFVEGVDGAEALRRLLPTAIESRPHNPS